MNDEEAGWMNDELQHAMLMLMACVPEDGVLHIPIERIIELSSGKALKIDFDDKSAMYTLSLTTEVAGLPLDDEH